MEIATELKDLISYGNTSWCWPHNRRSGCGMWILCLQKRLGRISDGTVYWIIEICLVDASGLNVILLLLLLLLLLNCCWICLFDSLSTILTKVYFISSSFRSPLAIMEVLILLSCDSNVCILCRIVASIKEFSSLTWTEDDWGWHYWSFCSKYWRHVSRTCDSSYVSHNYLVEFQSFILHRVQSLLDNSSIND